MSTPFAHGRWFLLMCATLLAGPVACGYTVSSRPGAVKPPDDGASGDERATQPLRIQLHTVENQITPPRPGLEIDFTRRLKDEIGRDGRLELGVGTGKGTRLRVTLLDFREDAAVRGFNNEQLEIALAASALVRRDDGGGPRDVRANADGGYAPALGETRDAGLERLWRDLARKVIDAIIHQAPIGR